MARPQAPDYEERREAIVEKASQLFAENGFLGTSVSQIADACGASKSLLYHYYPSKEDVLYAVMASHVDTLEEVVDDIAARQLEPRQALRQVLVEFMQEYVNAAARQKVVLNDLGHLPEPRGRAIVAKQRKIIDFVQALLVEINPGLADSHGVQRALTMLIFGMINWTSTWYKPDRTLTPVEVADLVYEMAIGGSVRHSQSKCAD